MTQIDFNTLNPTSTAVRRQWVNALITDVSFEAWTNTAARTIADSLGLDTATRNYVAPNGVSDLVDQFFDDQAMVLAQAQITRSEGTHKAVRDSVVTWLDLLAPHKHAVGLASERGASLIDGTKPFQQLLSTADVMWTLSADPIGNYNDTSRRALLAIALTDILRHWLSLDALDKTELENYVENRLRQVSGAGRKLGQFVKIFKR